MSLMNHTFQNNMNGIKQAANMFKAAQNPMAMLASMANQNPQVSQVLQMCHGQNPKDVFYNMCKQRGVNPDDVLNCFK